MQVFFRMILRQLARDAIAIADFDNFLVQPVPLSLQLLDAILAELRLMLMLLLLELDFFIQLSSLSRELRSS